MAAYSGNLGSIGFASSMANIQSWNMSATVEEAAATVFGSAWETVIHGRTDTSVTCEGYSQKGLDALALLGTSAELVLGMQSASGPGFSISNAILGSITETASRDGLGTLSYNFLGNDTLLPLYGATTGIAAAALSNTYHGKKSYCSVAAATFVDPISWSITLSAALHDVTPMATEENGILRVAGLKSATATVTCLKGSVIPQMLPGTVTDGEIATQYAIVLMRQGDTIADGQYSGTAMCTGYDIAVNVNNIETITYNLKFTGTVAYAEE